MNAIASNHSFFDKLRTNGVWGEGWDGVTTLLGYLALRACAEAGLILASVATHALTAGAIGGMTIGMMTRTARGHTGRPLLVSRLEVAAYLLVVGAAVVRVVLPLLAPQHLVIWWVAAAAAWALA